MEKGILLLMESRSNFNQTLCLIFMNELVFHIPYSLVMS